MKSKTGNIVILNEAKRSEESISGFSTGLLSALTIAFIFFSQCAQLFTQEVTLDYIFQDTNIINPRPSVKQVNAGSKKMFYYANDDYSGSLSLFDYNYVTGETYKYPDTGKSPSEFEIMPSGDLLSVIDGDVYISKNFCQTREYTKDIRLTETDKYEYSPHLYGDVIIYRRGGNYFLQYLKNYSSVGGEFQLTTEESDSISLQLVSVSKMLNETGTFIRLIFAKYDNSPKETILFPNYNGDFVSVEKKRRGISKATLTEYELKFDPEKNNKITATTRNITFPDSVRYSTQEVKYTPDAKHIILDADAMDRHTRKLFNYDIAAGKMREIYTESDTAWFERHVNSLSFINDSDFVFESEISGFNNIWRISVNGFGLKNITPGEQTVLESIVDRTRGKLYFTANPKLPINYNLYQTDFEGNDTKQLTTDPGDVENMFLAQDGSNIFYEHSYITSPNELYKFNTETYAQTQITNTISPKFSSVNWSVPELVTFNNEEDGHKLYSFVYKPKDFNPKKKYPLICFVHGAGYLQNVTNGFSPYRDNFMVNTYLVSLGYVVIDIDFHGSLGYGKDFRNKTYRNLGYWEVSDYISGVNYLNSLGYINPDKVGIYGGSYGGFTTLMALFRHPEIFKCGVALRAVANWKNYFYSNRWYTLARLGDYYDKDNEKYYEQSSAITYAKDLSVPLLLTHGMLDDNVFFQDMVQLTQKLIENKKDFDVMIYPKEYHGFHIQTSWLDQYKRITKFFEKNLK